MKTKVRLSVLSQLFSCSPRWIRDLILKGVLPKPVAGFLPLEECVTKYIHFLRTASPNQEYQKLRTIHLGVKIDKLKLEQKIQRGTLVAKEKFQQMCNQAGSDFQVACATLPQQLARVLVQMRTFYASESDEIYAKLVAAILDYSLKAMIRENFFHLHQETPRLSHWQWELLRLGAVKPDRRGNIFYNGRLTPAAEVVRAGEEAVKGMDESENG